MTSVRAISVPLGLPRKEASVVDLGGLDEATGLAVAKEGRARLPLAFLASLTSRGTLLKLTHLSLDGGKMAPTCWMWARAWRNRC